MEENNKQDIFVYLSDKLDLELKILKEKHDRLEDYIHQLARHANVELR